jgi:SAM-dependent methyltransferase
MEQPPREQALPGTHDWVVENLRRIVPAGSGVRVLDFGAGEGALCEKLLRSGYDVSACELYPENFRFAGIECRKVDAPLTIPFGDGEFDVLLAVEVVEHMEGQRRFLDEARRVLKLGGRLVLTTPNVLSLKSRAIFLFSGYFYSFGPLDPAWSKDVPLPHISPFTLDRYRFMLGQSGFELQSVSTDKFQRSSMFWGWLVPVIRLWSWKWWGTTENVRLQNSRVALFGRTLFVVAKKIGAAAVD